MVAPLGIGARRRRGEVLGDQRPDHAIEPDERNVIVLAGRIVARMDDDPLDPDLRRLGHLLEPTRADLGPKAV